MVYATSVLIGGTEVKSKLLKWKVTKTFGKSVGVAEIEFTPELDNVITLTNGQTLEVWRGPSTADYRWFKGTIYDYEREGGKIKVIGHNDFARERNASITKSYDSDVDPSAGVISKIALDMVTTFAGMDADSTTFQNSGTAHTISRYVCNHDNVFERTKFILDIINWYHYFDDHTAKVYAEGRGATRGGAALVVGQNVLNVPKWVHDSEQVVNVVEIVGAEDNVETTEEFSGTGSEDTFELNHQAISVKVFVGGTLQTGGKTDSTEGACDYQHDDDFEDASGNLISRIIFESGSIPPSGTNNVEVRYSYAVPVPVRSSDGPSIAKYGERLKQITLFDAKEVADALEMADGIIGQRKNDFVSTVLSVSTARGYNEGQLVPVTDDVNNESHDMVITKMEVSWPSDIDKLHVGDKELRVSDWLLSVEDRVKKLEKESSQNQELLYQAKNLTRELEITRTLTVHNRQNYNTFELDYSPLNTDDGSEWEYNTTEEFDGGSPTGDVQTAGDQLSLSSAPGSGTWTSEKFHFSSAWGYKIDCFVDGDVSDWSVAGANLARAIDTTGKLEGENSMKLTASAGSDGSYVEKTIDSENASDYRYIHVYTQASLAASDLLEVSIKNNGSWTQVGTISPSAVDTPEDFSFDLDGISHDNLEGIRITSNSDSAYEAYLDRIVITNSDSVTSTFKRVTWSETVAGGASVSCDLLDARDDSVIVSGYTSGDDLKETLPIDTPIKVKFTLSTSDANNPIVDDINISWIPCWIDDNKGEEVQVV